MDRGAGPLDHHAVSAPAVPTSRFALLPWGQQEGEAQRVGGSWARALLVSGGVGCGPLPIERAAVPGVCVFRPCTAKP